VSAAPSIVEAARARSRSLALAGPSAARQSSARARRNPYSVYRGLPVAYAERVLGVRLTDAQKAQLASIVRSRRTVVKASHAVGKTFVAAIAACYWYDCWDEHIVYITAPTWSQALGLTFKQVRRFRLAARLPGDILDTGLVRDSDRLRRDAHFIKALNAESGEGFQGEHTAPVLVIVEEGVGVPRYIWEATEGLMTHPDCRLFAIGNPTDDANSFGEACDSPLFDVHTVRALDHPNIEAELRGEVPPFPAAVRLLWLLEMLTKEAEVIDEPAEDAFQFYDLETVRAAVEGTPVPEDAQLVWYMPTPYFQGRVMGEFPSQAESQVVPRGWLAAQPRREPEGEPEIGCDVARFGDDRSAAFLRRGPCAIAGREVRKFDSVAVASMLKDMARFAAEMCSMNPKRVLIKIDVTGGLGTGPLDILLSERYRAVGVNSSSRANNAEQFKNKRSELWFDTRDRAREKRLDLSRLPLDLRRRLEKELSAPKYTIQSGKKVVEEKAKMKERLGASPDLADGLNLAFAPVVEDDDAPRSFSSNSFA
jgi:hypothetical protein